MRLSEFSSPKQYSRNSIPPRFPICSCRASGEKWHEIYRQKNDGHFRALFLRKRNSKPSPDISLHSAWRLPHMDGWFHEEMSLQHLRDPCKDETLVAHTRERQRGAQKSGGGGKTSQGDPPQKTISDPPPWYVFPPSPPIPFLLFSRLESSEFPSRDHLRTYFRRVSRKWFPTAILARFCFSVRFAPPL